MARNMDDLILLDSIVRSVNATTRGNGGLPAPGVSCDAPVNRDMDMSGVTLGLPVSYWADIDPAVSPTDPTAQHAGHGMIAAGLLCMSC